MKFKLTDKDSKGLESPFASFSAQKPKEDDAPIVIDSSALNADTNSSNMGLLLPGVQQNIATSGDLDNGEEYFGKAVERPFRVRKSPEKKVQFSKDINFRSKMHKRFIIDENEEEDHDSQQSSRQQMQSIKQVLKDGIHEASMNASMSSKSSKNKRKQELKKYNDKQLWMKMQSQSTYSLDLVSSFPSIKDIFRQRCQFNKQKRDLKQQIEQRQKMLITDSLKMNKQPQFISHSFEKINKKEKKQYVKTGFDDMDPQRDDEELSGWRRHMAEYEEKILLIKDDCSFFVHGKYFKFSKRSLGMLDNKNKVRIFLVWLITSKWFENLIISLILVNSLFLGIKDYTDVENVTPINSFVESLEPFFMYFFLGECIAKILAMGFILGNKSYLNDAWNWLDFTVVVTSLLNELPSMQNMSGLRTFRLFRPLRSLTTMPSMKLLIGTLLSSVSHLGGILGLAMFFFMIFAILGVSLLNGRIHYRCYETPEPLANGTWNLVKGDNKLCSSYRECPVGYCNSLFNASDSGYYINTTDFWQDTDILELNYGITNFDHIGYAFLTIFQCITEEGWTKIMNIYQDAYITWFVNVYFIGSVVICSFFLLNLTIAVMLMKYEDLDKNQANSKHKEELRQIGISIKLPPALIEFLIKQDSIQLSQHARRMLKQEDSFFKQLFAPKKMIVDKTQSYYQNVLVKICLKIVMNPYFDGFILFVIILNTICLAMDQYPELDQKWLDMLQLSNHVFTFIFTIEVILKVIGLGVRCFFQEKFNQFDLVIVIISLVEMEMVNQQGQGVFSALRAFRLFKIFKLFKVGDLRILIDSIAFTMTTIGDYVILLCLFIYVFALIGMSFFAGALKFNESDQVDFINGQSPRNNFDHIHWSVITIFQVLLGEDWNFIMYNCMRSVHPFAACYFILLVLTGNIIMLNLFLAILLGNFEKARNFGQKKKVFEAFKEIMMNDRSLNQALDIILCDMSVYAKVKILKWDEKMVNKIHNKGDSLIAQDLLENRGKFLHEHSEQSFSDHECLDNQNMTQELIQLSHVENESIISIDGITEADTKMEQLGPKQKSKGLKKQVADFSRDKGMGDESHFKSHAHDKGQLTFAVDKAKKKPKKFSQTTFKYHKFNPKLLRLQELNRAFQYKPQPALKAIIEKEHDLGDYDQHPYTVEDLKELYSSYQRSEDTVAERKKLHAKVPPINPMQTQMNIEQFKTSGMMRIKHENQKQYFEKQEQVTLGKEVKRKQRLQRKCSHDFKAQKLTLSKRSKSGLKHTKTVVEKLQLSDQPQKEKVEETKTPEEKKEQPKGPEDDDDSDEELTLRGIFERLLDRFQYSSLFVFHKDTKLRKYCLLLAESPENLEDLRILEHNRMLYEEVELEEINKQQNSFQSISSENDRSTGKKTRHQMILTALNPEDGEQNLQLINQNDDDIWEVKIFDQHPSKVFENMVLTLIILSGIAMMVDNPLDDPNGRVQSILQICDVIFTLLFTIEAFIKIIAKGLLFNNLGPVLPYLKSYWNLLDAFVVAASLVDLATRLSGMNMHSLQALKALRALRALRPLRMISRNEGMRLVTNALLASLPSMTNVLLVCSLFILIFGIMGVGFFKGMFYHCIDRYDAEEKIDMNLVDTKQDCLDLGGEWVNQNSHFDNTPQAMNTLFQMTSTEGWVKVMYSGIDSRGVDLQPKRNANIATIIYFVTFMIIGSQFIINLFVGVVIDNFNTIKEKEELGNMFVTEQQKSWIEIQKIGLNKRLKTKINEPTDWRLSFFLFVKNKWFDFAITGVIVLNTVVMTLRSYRMSEDLEEFSEVANLVFAVIFNLEMILKLFGLGRTYFLDNWNNFDMFIVIGTDVGLLLSFFDVGGGFATAATVIRSVRIMRMFRLIKSSVHIRLILDTILNILPQITNVMSLILLLFFIYASLAINLFSGVMLQKYLDEKNNFQTFLGSMKMFMKFSTGEDWNEFMYELANTGEYNGVQCEHQQSHEDVLRDGIKGCGTFFAYPFFISFTILVTMLIMNLSVAAVIEGLDTAKKENMGIVAGDEIEILIDLWQHYDPLASGWITMNDLVFLLYELPPPLGKRPSSLNQYDEQAYDPDSNKNQGTRQQDRYLVNYEKRIVMKKVEALELLKDLKIRMYPDATKQINYVDVFKALIKRILEEQNVEYQLSSNLNRKMDNQWAKKHKDVGKDPGGPLILVREEQAGLIITRWARKCLNQQKNKYLKNNDMNKKRQHQRAQKHHHHHHGAQSNQKAEEIGKQQAQLKRKNRHQVMIEQAQIIYNIIKGVNDSGENECDQDVSEFQVKNEYTWKQIGGDKVLNQLDRSNSDLSEDEHHHHHHPCEEDQYQKFKEQQNRLKSKNYLNDLFTLRKEEEVEQFDTDSEDDAEFQLVKHSNIAINVGNLDSDVIQQKTIFKYSKELGKRPVRDQMAERYQREMVQEKLEMEMKAKKATEEHGHCHDHSKPVTPVKEKEPQIEEEEPKDLTLFEEQKQKFQKMQLKQKLEMQKKKASSREEEQLMRPQIHRNRDNFVNGSSGKTIEMNTEEQSRRRFPYTGETLHPIIDNNQQDLIGRPEMDQILQPSKAILRKTKKSSKNLLSQLQMDEISQVKFKFSAGDQVQVSKNHRKGAISSLKPREISEHFTQHAAQENNFFEEVETPQKQYDKFVANNMVIDADNFPKDINIVDKEDIIFHQAKLVDKTIKFKPLNITKDDSEPKQNHFKPKLDGEQSVIDQNVDFAYKQALNDIEYAIAFNDAVLDQADDSLCTDESMNDVQ